LFLSLFAHGFHPPAWSLGFSLHGGLRVVAPFVVFLGHVFQHTRNGRCCSLHYSLGAETGAVSLLLYFIGEGITEPTQIQEKGT